MQNVAAANVLITGAARGVGRQYAELAVAENAGAVVLWDIDAEALMETAHSLGSAGRVDTMQVDVSRLETLESAAQQVLQRYGRIDVLINNAGIVRGKLFWEHDAADIELTMRVNAIAPMHITRLFLPAMIASARPARIVNVSSAASLVSNPRMSVYCGSKWAATGWSDSLRLELHLQGHRHVAVTTVCPAYISTGMFTGARGPLLTPIMTPEYVAARVWKAMKKGQPQLLMPRTTRLALLARGLLPLPLWDLVAGGVFGVYRSMDGFQGRRQ